MQKYKVKITYTIVHQEIVIAESELAASIQAVTIADKNTPSNCHATEICYHEIN